MEETNKDVFDEVESKEEVEIVSTPDTVVEEATVNVEEPAKEENDLSDEGMDEDVEFGDFSDEEKYDIQLEEADLDKEFVIEKVEVRKPRIMGPDGRIEPFTSDKNPQMKWYESKVHITYKDSSYKSVLPKVRWYLNIDEKTGKKIYKPWINVRVTEEDLDDQFTSVISKVYYRYCKNIGKEVGKVTHAEFFSGLEGKKVKLEQYKTKFKGEERYRIDIKEFI